MITVENHVGRLVEFRFAPPISVEELGGFHGMVTRTIGQTTGQLVGCTDLTGARVFDQTVTNRLVKLIRQDNPRVERNAILVGESAVFSMQIERIIREAGSPSRRAFRSSMELAAWLGEILNAAERDRLSTFLRDTPRHPRESGHR